LHFHRDIGFALAWRDSFHQHIVPRGKPEDCNTVCHGNIDILVP
jgi:hypothetical protein